ncbi:hypothetical protein C9439_00450 [archaeon SCG-AAA382B04]|nr:hypothetical protein C9439_00450 [archaeon SCG-AAA382B04]
MKEHTKYFIVAVIIISLFLAVFVPFYISEVEGPSKIQNLTVSREGDQAVLTWDRVTSDYYLVYEGNEFLGSTEGIRYTDSGLKKESSYNYKVVAVSDKKIGQYSTVLLEAVEEEPKTKGELELVGQFKYIGQGTDPYFIGEVKYTGEKNIKDLNVEADFYLGEEMIGSTREEHLHADTYGFDVVRRGEKVPYRVQLEMSHNEIIRKMSGNLEKEYRVDIFLENFSITEENPYLDYEIEHEARSTETAYIVEGEIKNTGYQMPEKTIICTKFYNQTYGLIGFSKDTLKNVEPGTEFQTSFKKTYRKIENGEVADNNKPLSELVDSYEIQVRGK